MSRFVGDLWRRVSELAASSEASSSSSSAFPFAFDASCPLPGYDSLSPWRVHVGRDLRCAEPASEFGRVLVLSAAGTCAQARLDIRRLKTLRHPRIIAHLGSVDNASSSSSSGSGNGSGSGTGGKGILSVSKGSVPAGSLLLATEWFEPQAQENGTFKFESVSEAVWGRQCVVEAFEFLNSAGLPRVCCIEAVVGTAGGAMKVAPFGAWCDGNGAGGDALDPDVLFPIRDADGGSLHLELAERIAQWPVLTATDRAALLRRLVTSAWNDARLSIVFKRHVIVAGLARLRVALGEAMSVEEARLLFELAPGVFEVIEKGPAGKCVEEKVSSTQGKSVCSIMASSMTSYSPDFMCLLGPMLAELWSRATIASTAADSWLLPFLVTQLGRPEFDALLAPAFVQARLFPVLSGQVFVHASPALRGLALRGALALAPRLGPKLIANDLLRGLARLQSDLEPAIRAEAFRGLVALLRLLIPEELGKKIAGPAIARALQDAAVLPNGASPRRLALSALQDASIRVFVPRDELCGRLMPLICPLMVDSAEEVSGAAFACMEELMRDVKLQRVGKGRGDVNVNLKGNVNVNVNVNGGMNRNVDAGMNVDVNAEDGKGTLLNEMNALSVSSQSVPLMPPPQTLTNVQASAGSRMKLGSIKKIA